MGHKCNISSWFQTFAVFWMLYAFFWVIPRRLNFVCQRFGTLFPLHTYPSMKMEQTGCFETLAYKIQTPGNYPEESIQYYLYIMMLISTKNVQRSLKWRRFMEGAQSRGLSTVASSNYFSKSVISHFDRGKFSCNMNSFFFLTPHWQKNCGSLDGHFISSLFLSYVLIDLYQISSPRPLPWTVLATCLYNLPQLCPAQRP